MKPNVEGLWYALGVVLYVTGIANVLTHGDELFGRLNNAAGPLVFLLLFIVSALITSGLVFGRPIWLYVAGEKQAALTLWSWTVSWLVALTVLLIAIIALR